MCMLTSLTIIIINDISDDRAGGKGKPGRGRGQVITLG